MRTNRVTATIVLSTLAAVGCQSTGHDAADVTRKASLLFVQTAESGALTPLGGADGSFCLRLDDPSPQVVYFTDRPVRRSGVVETDEFLAGWRRGADSFADDPPNAALLTTGGGATLVFELQDPVRTSDGAVEYTATMVGGSDRFRVAPTAVRASDAPRDLGRLALFIDNLADASSFGRSFAFNQSDPENQPDDAGLPGSTSLNQGWPAD